MNIIINFIINFLFLLKLNLFIKYNIILIIINQFIKIVYYIFIKKILKAVNFI